MKHPDVKEVAVVGVIDSQGLTKPHAFLERTLEEDTSASSAEDFRTELCSFAEQHLERYKIPRAVHVLDTLPRTHLGKIDRGKLRTLKSLDKAGAPNT